MYYYILHRLFVPLAEIVQNSCSKHGDMHGYVLVSPNVWRLQLRLEDTGIEELVYLSFIGLVYSKSRNWKLPTSFTCAVWAKIIPLLHSENQMWKTSRATPVVKWQNVAEFGRVTIITIPYPQIICSMYRMIYIQCPTVGKVHLSVYRAIVSW